MRSGVPFFPYEVFYPIDKADVTRVNIADAVIESGWHHQNKPRVSLRPPVDWANTCAPDRSWQFYLHAWYGLAPILGAYQKTKSTRYLEFAVRTALDWIAAHPSTSAGSELAWYDMSVALRGYRFAYIADAALRADLVTPDQALKIRESLILHLAVFASDDRFAAHSNHGFYFAAGQAAMARRFPDLPGAKDAIAQAANRIRYIVASHFTREGVHKEHSPEYHQSMLGTLRGLVDVGLITDAEILSRQSTIEEAFSWFILPNGRLTMFGDSIYRKFSWNSDDARMHPALRFVASAGAKGQLPSQRLKTFPESGYAVVRIPGEQDFESGTQLAFNAAFHSRSHKHADDLSFVWYDCGTELLVDAGRFGYRGSTDPSSELFKQGFWYADPSRVYVESTAAHNTVEVDGRSYNRHLEEPYGSALRRTAAYNGLVALEGEVSHMEGVQHTRILILQPRQWLLVFDRLSAPYDHDFVQYFHFAPEHQASRSQSTIQVPLDRNVDLNLIALDGRVPKDFVHGRKRPELRGWISRRDGILEPCWTVSYGQECASDVTFSTLFTLGTSAPTPVDRPTISDSGQKGRWSWEDDEGLHDLQLRRRSGEDMQLEHEIRVN
jgi:Heparinase II/III-like protein/Heparinase II/III N-terminus